MKQRIIKYSIAFVVGIALVLMGLGVNHFSTDPAIMPVQDQYRILANSFSTAAALLLGLGALVFIGSTGQFDGLTYVLRHLVNAMVPGKNKKEDRFYDYKVAKMEKRKKNSFLFLIITGGVFVIPAVIFILLFHSVS